MWAAGSKKKRPDGEGPRVQDAPQLPYCRWTLEERPGEVVEGILRAADELAVDAIYLSTTWSKGGFGRTGGDVTESVIAGASCPSAVSVRSASGKN